MLLAPESIAGQDSVEDPVEGTSGTTCALCLPNSRNPLEARRLRGWESAELSDSLTGGSLGKKLATQEASGENPD